MTLEQTALTFAQEVMGWEDAVIGTAFDLATGNERHFIGREISSQILEHTDLNAVLEAVRKWCDRSNCWLDVRLEGVLTWVEVWHSQLVHGDRIARAYSSSSFAEALILACIEAQRRLRGGSNG